MSLLNKIKKVFSKEESNFVEVKTKDNAILRVDDLAVDQPIVEITEDGEVEVKDGDYVLEDGITIVVEGGVIKEVIPAEEEETDEEMSSEDISKRIADLSNEQKSELMDVLSKFGKEESKETSKFYDVFLKNGGRAHVINTKDGEINKGDKFTIEGKEAASGEYELNSGETLTVGEGGVIDEIATVDAPKDEDSKEAPVDSKEEQEDEDIDAVVSNLKDLVKEMKDLKSQFKDVKSNVEELDKDNKEMTERVNKFAGAPSAEPTKTKIDFKKANRDEKLKYFSRRK